MITLTPACGRDYKSLEALQADLAAGNDFILNDFGSRYDGKPVNAPQLREVGVGRVSVRYGKLRRHAVIDVPEVGGGVVSQRKLQRRIYSGEMLAPDLGGVHILDSSFVDCHVAGGVFNRSTLEDVTAEATVFSGTNFRQADLRFSELSRVSFVGCNFRGTQFTIRSAERVQLIGCNLSGVTFHGQTVGRIELIGCRMQDVLFNNACHVRAGKQETGELEQ